MSIEIKNLNFSYGNHKVLSDINLTINSGDTVTLLGPNGVGKSTLFKCILGLNQQYSGQILIDDQEIKQMSIKARAQAMSYIPQRHSPTYDYSVLDVVLMGCSASLKAFKTPGSAQNKIAEEALAMIGIENLKDRVFSEISGGEQQMVLIARAIAQNGKILVMDEPTSALDFGNIIKVQQCIKDISSKGYTILQSSHQPDQAYLYSDKIILLKDGAVFKYGAPKDIITSQNMSCVYGTGVDVISVNDDQIRICLPASCSGLYNPEK